MTSKSTITLLNGESVTYNVDDCFQSPWLNFGFHSGIGIKYNQFYIGSEFGLDFIPECNYKVGAHYDNDDIIKFEYSISVGYEF